MEEVKGIVYELSNAKGRWVEMVVVTDDCAVPWELMGSRGVAGMVLVHKVVGIW